MDFWRIFIIISLFSIFGCDNFSGNTNATTEETVLNKSNRIFAGIKRVEKKEDKTAVAVKKSVVNSGGFMSFYIYSDKGSKGNHYIPSGFMGDWKCIDFNDSWKENCQEGSTCIKIKYDLECSREGQRWSGIYWLNPPNNWGKRKGGYNLTGAEKLIFWAKGAEGGEQIQEFKIGGIGANYPDSDTTAVGPIILSSVWKEYTIDLKGKDLSYISGGFSWTTSEDVNQGSCIFYLDNIKFE